jgi:NADH:ubiquinone oxidoreductase subunit E
MSKDRLTIHICQGGDCKDQKAKKVLKRFEELIAKQNLEETVRIKTRDCMNHCGHGPVVGADSIKGVYKEVKPRKAEKILERILAGREPKKQD